MLKEFDTNSLPGLSEAEAAERLRKEGFNELPSAKKRGILAIAFDVVREPMFLLLVACGIIYLILGDIREALMLLGFVFVVMGITLYQERKTERALDALRDLSSPRALVIRDGKQRRIAGREVARGDVLILSEGDRVPADALLLSCINLSVDESLLTGESMPVRKAASKTDRDMGRPGGENLPFIYSGTLVVQGQGIAQVKATGMGTELGKIGKSLQTLEPEETLLQKETRRLVNRLAIAGVMLCSLVVVLYGISRGNWLEGFLAGITLAMATLPEEFPVVLTIFLALGAWRISKKQVLTRRVPAVETLGACTVLCVDKTGTLTMNRMSVSRIFAGGAFCDISAKKRDELPDYCHEIVEFGILASKTDPFDPMEKALRQLGLLSLSNTEHLHEDWTLVHEYPLSENLLALSHVWKSPDGDEYVIASKGAPEAIFDLCHLSETEKESLVPHINAMADEGLRVLGVARAGFKPAELPGGHHDFTFRFLGLIGLADPVRPTVADAIRECNTAGMRVVMITGDYPGTAQNIAKQIGLDAAGECITGPELDGMDGAELRARIKNVNIFARVVPEQKLRIVTALKAAGEIVAMTGDGVNDAPALKSAHIGIAMGERGTDVAREAASLVLLDDDFSSIVGAVRMGRRIFDNLKKAMAYIFSIHVPIIGLSLLPVLFGWPLILLPVHIVFLELIIDPACSIIFEAENEERDIMRRSPRDPKEPLFGLRSIGISMLQGASVLAIVATVFVIALYRGLGELDARVLTFTTLVIANLGLIFSNRSWSRTILSTLRSPNPALWWISGGTLLFLGLILYTPFLRQLFHFSKLHLSDLLICISAGVISILWFELLKAFNGQKKAAGQGRAISGK
ncbi:MAG: cation-translocating P-type ATPase [Nitrospirota bacterium]|nr:cation-translocating P-type ATPase [Nitrospirota bacterium]